MGDVCSQIVTTPTGSQSRTTDDTWRTLHRAIALSCVPTVINSLTAAQPSNSDPVSLTSILARAVRTQCAEHGLAEEQHAKPIYRELCAVIASVVPEEHIEPGGYLATGVTPSNDPDVRRQQIRQWVIDMMGQSPKPLLLAFMRRLQKTTTSGKAVADAAKSGGGETGSPVE